MDFWIEFFDICFHEWIVSDCERKSLQIFELEFMELCIIILNWPRVLIWIKSLAFNFLNIVIACPLEIFLCFLEDICSLHKLTEFLCERCHLDGLLWVKYEMNNTAISTLNSSRFFTSSILCNHSCFDSILLLGYDIKLLSNKIID